MNGHFDCSEQCIPVRAGGRLLPCVAVLPAFPRLPSGR